MIWMGLGSVGAWVKSFLGSTFSAGFLFDRFLLRLLFWERFLVFLDIGLRDGEPTISHRMSKVS